jgi:hypothetical protein
MLLYHYSKAPLRSLTTRRHRGGLTEQELKEGYDWHVFRQEPAPYYDHISFFFEPAPLDILGTIFAGTGHDFWTADAYIYEHVVESSRIGNFKYFITETPEDIAVMDTWPDDDDEAKKQAYFRRSARRRKALGHVGRNNAAFEQAATPFVGGIRRAYQEVRAKWIDDNRLQYAAFVPHVMLYPERGEIRLIRPAQRVQVGPVNASLEGYPLSARW